jgi:hypothetical protein
LWAKNNVHHFNAEKIVEAAVVVVVVAIFVSDSLVTWSFVTNVKNERDRTLHVLNLSLKLSNFSNHRKTCVNREKG